MVLVMVRVQVWRLRRSRDISFVVEHLVLVRVPRVWRGLTVEMIKENLYVFALQKLRRLSEASRCTTVQFSVVRGSTAQELI